MNVFTGLRIALNGCFDILHDAHKRLIARAVHLTQGGVLQILLNSDDSVRRLKGPERPWIPYSERRQAIHNLATEHSFTYARSPRIEVIRFGTEEELKTALDRFAPDIIIKGNDYTDVSEVTGYPDWPILVVPRGTDPQGRDISSTKIGQERCLQSMA